MKCSQCNSTLRAATLEQLAVSQINAKIICEKCQKQKAVDDYRRASRTIGQYIRFGVKI